MNPDSSMDAYLTYLKGRIKKFESKAALSELAAARAEFNRALAFARRHGQTIKYSAPVVEGDR